MLKVNNLKTGYGKRLIINNVSLEADSDEIVALIGHNGAGKTTILKSIIGILPKWDGSIIFNGSPISSRPHININKGICLLPQGNQVFDELTIQENIELSSYIVENKNDIKDRIEKIYYRFPILKSRRKEYAGNLSGGEQQILAIGMILVRRPKLLLMDEPSLGLSPAAVKDTFKLIMELNTKYNIAIVIIEQKVKEVLKIASRAYVFRLGKVALEGNASDILREKKYKEIFLS